MVNENASDGFKKLKFISEKGVDDLYPFSHVDFSENDVKQHYNNVTGPYSLFVVGPNEEAKEKVELERPITPIDDEIKAPPTSFQKLAKLVRRRVAAKPNLKHITVDDQKELGAIIMGELNSIWSDIRLQVEDPFLSVEENRELQRRIVVQIVTVCEQLFLHYVEKAKILNQRGVFSGPANTCRLKAQLALDANKFLNVLTIRRYIVGDMRPKDDEKYEKYRNHFIPEQPATKLSYKGFLEASRPKSKTKRDYLMTREEEMKKMVKHFPSLDASKLVPLIADLPKDRPVSEISATSILGITNTEPRGLASCSSLVSSKASKLPPLSQTSSASAALKQKKMQKEQEEMKQSQVMKDRLLERRTDSVPNLVFGETIMERLGIDPNRYSPFSMNDLELEDDDLEQTDRSKKMDEVEEKKPEQGTREYAHADLLRLIKPAEEGGVKEDEEDLPPLLQALTRSAKHDGKKAWIEQQLKELEEKEEQRRLEESIEIKEPTHPQPATVTNKMPNKMVVRTSDIRVSERVCLSSITLKKHATVYNDLMDEIDPITVKNLDSNLYLGNEINEVYKEIMKTVPYDHLDLENDGSVEESADKVNLSSALASATLSKKIEERVINPELERVKLPPWGDQAISDWVKTPEDPPRDFRGRPTIHPRSPRGRVNEWTDLLGANKAEEFVPAAPPQEKSAHQEFLARTYASWLMWWKNNVSTDDYMKYLSTQETDYMGVIFHFYNSDDEDEEEDIRSPTKTTRKSVRQLEEAKLKKLNEIRAVKNEYKDGLWNVNAVMLGGLGKDPVLEDENSDAQTKAPSTTETESKMVRARTMLVSRKSSRKDGSEASPRPKPREGTTSRVTQQTADASNVEKVETEISPLNAPQSRLEKLWNALLMPDNLRLDMAIKYSSDDWHEKLDEAIDEWEDAVDLILAREELIAKLEKFERLASDPNRYFEKGQRGSSLARLQESRIRSSYYRKLDQIEEDLKYKLAMIKAVFHDDITFQGRLYKDKMQWDKTEMLYWLQEERKQQALDYEGQMRNLPKLPVHMSQLAPIEQFALKSKG